MSEPNAMDRRRFLQTTAAGLGAAAVGQSVADASNCKTKHEEGKGSCAEPKVDPKKLIWKNKQPGMEYERLGRTNFMCGRIVAGWIRETRLLRRLYAAGVNYYDNARGYGEYEVNMKPFLEKNRDNLWITSKATDIAGHGRIDAEVAKLYRQAMKNFVGKEDGDLLALYKESVKKQKETGEKPDLRPVGKLIAEMYLRKLDESLERMGIDDVDCYMVHGIEIPWIFDCLELWEAYEKVHKAGKVKHFGYSVHKHHKDVMAAGVVANEKGPWKIDLIMPGINPESYDHLHDELVAYRKQDVGIITMKTTGIKNRPIKEDREEQFKKLMGGKDYNEWERCKLWMLHMTEGLVDACIAGISNNDEMQRTLALPSVKMTAEAERELRAIVKYEMSNSCSLCGQCETNCPENIAVTDMIRYHAYIHQYDEKEMARELYAMTGQDPAKLCSDCGSCMDVCPTNVPVTKLLYQLSHDMA